MSNDNVGATSQAQSQEKSELGPSDTGRFMLPFKPKVGRIKSAPQVVSAATLRAREIPPRTYLPLLGQDGYFILGKSHLLAAFSKTGKTELLARCIADWISLPIIAGGDLEAKRDSAGDVVRDEAGKLVYQPHMLYPRILYFGEETQDAWTERLQNQPASKNWDQMDYVPVLEQHIDPMDMMLLVHSMEGEAEDFAGEGHTAGWPEGSHEQVGYDIVVIDSIRSLLRIENENDNSEVVAAVLPWVQLSQRTGITMILLHHTRKTGGDHGVGVAGGSGLLAPVDYIIQMERDKDDPDGPRRTITSTGRSQADPDRAVIEWVEVRTPSGMSTGRSELQFVGAKQKVTRAGVEHRIARLLEVAERPMLTTDVIRALADEPPAPSEITVKRALKEMAESGRIQRDPDIREDATRRTVRWAVAPVNSIDV